MRLRPFCPTKSHSSAPEMIPQAQGDQNVRNWFPILCYSSFPITLSVLRSSNEFPSSVHPGQLRCPFAPLGSQWLSVLLPFNLLRLMIFIPFLDLMRAKKPCLLFRTLWLGLNVARGPFLTCVPASAGCDETFGERSSGAATVLQGEEDEGGIARGCCTAKGWNGDGRRNVRVARVLSRHH